MKPYYDEDGITIYHGDCREVLPFLDPVGLVLTDPPYGIVPGAATWRNNGAVIADIGEEEYNAEVKQWRELTRLSQSAFVVEFGKVWRIQGAWEALGLERFHEYHIVKTAPPPSVRPTFVSAIESAMVMRRGDARWKGGGYVPNVWKGMSPNRQGNGLHPTQKPVEPFRVLIEVLADGMVLDPFMGSGTTLRAARDMGRPAIGVEVSERYCEIAVQRLAQGVLSFGGS